MGLSMRFVKYRMVLIMLGLMVSKYHQVRVPIAPGNAGSALACPVRTCTGTNDANLSIVKGLWDHILPH